MTFSRRRKPILDLPKLGASDAKKRIADLVARRDHSEKEIRAKLALRCEPDTIEDAVAWAKEQNWLERPEVLTEKFAEQMNRRGKGIHHINQKLKELGLSTVKADQEDEFEKAKRLISNKWSIEDFRGLGFQESQKLKAKIMRFLFARGFESDVVSSILKNEFKAGAISHDEEH